MSNEHRAVLGRVIQNVIVKTCESFMPKDPKGLLLEAAMGILPLYPVEENLQRAVARCAKGSAEKRLLLAITYGCVGREKEKDIIASDFICTKGLNDHGSGDDSSQEDCNGKDEDSIQTRKIATPPNRMNAGNFFRAVRRADDDWKFFEDHGRILVQRRGRKNVSDASISECIQFIFHPTNRELVASGIKTFD